MNPSDAAYAGQEIYSRAFLRIYDPVILGFYGNVVWRCPTSRLVEQYRQHVGRSHLDVGPGTGYFLENARLPDDAQITLLDPNPDVLAHAARRLSDRYPSAVQADVLKPLPFTAKRFDSVALNYVLHCLPGPPVRKAAAVQNVAAVMRRAPRRGIGIGSSAASAFTQRLWREATKSASPCGFGWPSRRAASWRSYSAPRGTLPLCQRDGWSRSVGNGSATLSSGRRRGSKILGQPLDKEGVRATLRSLVDLALRGIQAA